MSMLNGLPSLDEIIAALESPVVPQEQSAEHAAGMELSAEDMLKEIHTAVMNLQSNGVTTV